MDFLLLALLILPFAVAVLIVAVSSFRRRHHAKLYGMTEPVHRAQAGTAAAQSTEVHPPGPRRVVRGGRERRASSALRATDD